MGSMTSPVLDPTNPFAQPSALPYALPDFTKIAFEHLEPAIRAGIAQERQEIEAIATNSEPATVANTLEALERSGDLLDRVLTVFFNQLGSDTHDGLDQLEEDITPDLSAHSDAIEMDGRLYARVLDLVAQVEAGTLTLDGPTAYLLTETEQDFRRSGVGLAPDDQDTLRDLNSKISSLEARFGRLLLAGTNDAAVLIEDASDLDGLAPDSIAAAAQAATAREHEGYLLELQLPSQQGVLAQLTNPRTRARVHAASVTRGALPGENDTRPVIIELVHLRARKAQLLGYEHYAAYIAADATARTTPAIMGMLSDLAPKAVANARLEGAALADFAAKAPTHDDVASAAPAVVTGDATPGSRDLGTGTGTETEVAAADWAFYSEAVRAERFNLSDSDLRPYLELDTVLTRGVFAAATALYGITFTPRPDLVAYHPLARIWEVFEADATPIGLFVGDFFTRESKSGGAWMNNLVDQSGLLGRKPVVVNNLNIPAPPAGEPALLTWDEVITLFHEFGHALHGLFSNVYYPSHSGTNVPRDFVEYPSQVNEMWAWDRGLLAAYAVHVETGEPMPSEWIDTLVSSRQFNEGFATTEYLAAALLDQAWHQMGPDDTPTSPDDVEAFEARALAAVGLDYAPVVPRYRSTYFNHIFGGGYSAGYYSYIWSEVLDADTAMWFESRGGMTIENGRAFRDGVLSVGGSLDPIEAFAAMRGRHAEIAPLLVRRGLSEISPDGVSA